MLDPKRSEDKGGSKGKTSKKGLSESYRGKSRPDFRAAPPPTEEEQPVADLRRSRHKGGNKGKAKGKKSADKSRTSEPTEERK